MIKAYSSVGLEHVPDKRKVSSSNLLKLNLKYKSFYLDDIKKKKFN
jgi:hypothetical protein